MFLFRRSFFSFSLFFLLFLLSAAFADAAEAPASGESKKPSSSASAPLSDGVSDLLNKTMAAISDLTFHQHDPLLSNTQYALIEGAATLPGSRQNIRVQGEKMTMRDTATAGLLFSNDPAAADMCRDLGAKMQALYAYFVFPLDEEIDEFAPPPVSGASGGVMIPGR